MISMGYFENTPFTLFHVTVRVTTRAMYQPLHPFDRIGVQAPRNRVRDRRSAHSGVAPALLIRTLRA
jgi:hypothetical protein